MGSGNHDDKTAGRVLLPAHVVPTRYDLALTPNIEAFTFTGTVDITFRIDGSLLNETNNKSITLHAKELLFSTASYHLLDGPDATPVTAEQMNVNLKATTVEFLFPEPIPPDASTLKLTVAYTGFLNDQMAGFYRSTYTDIQGQSKIMVSTQFEALDARRCFPCVDEPSRKAVFGVTLTVPAHLTCLSNMPEAKVTAINAQQKCVTFMDSVVMSTYLLAFVVGEFDFLQTRSAHGVLIKVYTPPGKAAAGQFALDAAARALDAYNDFFNLPYPLPKLDMVAIPEFAAGAMENWGLVTYREVDLLIDPVKASTMQKQRVAVVVTHELAHQWFGNLVTMAWWDDLWLNEGFASWAENWATNVLYPEYRMWDQFTTGHLSTALRLDALQSSHPIQVPIAHAEEVEEVFDAISYCKGGSVVRMIKAVIGLSAFQDGLGAYMKKHAYGNTETYDLWNAWEASSGMPIGEMMKSWTEQMGFPLVCVRKEDFADDKVVLELDQTWFLSDGSDMQSDKVWTIPILTCTGAGAQADMTLMRDRTATVTIPFDAKDTAPRWIKLNAGQEVPMRVLPGVEMLRRMEVAIASKSMSAIDRAGVLNDSMAVVKAGHMSPEAMMTLLKSYKDEDEYVVWEGLSDALGGLDAVLSDDENMTGYFRGFAKTMVVNLMNKVGWEASDSDQHLTKLLRGIMINLLGAFAYDDESVQQEAKKRFEAFLEDANDMESLPSDMRTAVFKIVLKNGSAKEYEQVKAYFATASDNAERKHVLNSLGCIRDDALKLATMEWSLSGEIKLQDFFYLMGSVGRSSKQGREIAWKFFQENFERIRILLQKAHPALMDACIVMCAGGFCSEERADEIDTFFQAHPLPSSTRKIAQTTEHMRANGKFLRVLKASDLAKAEFWEKL
jgi:puromycin-sensitive aminopeptidase